MRACRLGRTPFATGFSCLTSQQLSMSSSLRFYLKVRRLSGSIACSAVLVLTDIAARITISRRPVRELIRPLTLAEMLAAISFLWPIGGGAFLRALRTVRLLQTYAFLERLRNA